MWKISHTHNLGWLGYVCVCVFVCVCLCVCVFVCSISYMVLSVMGGGTPRFGADLEGGV